MAQARGTSKEHTRSATIGDDGSLGGRNCTLVQPRSNVHNEGRAACGASLSIVGLGPTKTGHLRLRYPFIEFVQESTARLAVTDTRVLG